MQTNISETNGFIRLALGASLTAYGIAHLTREKNNRSLGSLLVTAGAMKMAEGVFRYCPTKALINSNVKEAVNTSFEEFMDGDSLMQAFRSTYEGKNNSTQNKSNSSQKAKENSKGNQNIGEIVAKTAESTGSLTSAATKVATTMAQNSQQQSKSSNNNQNQSLNH